MKRLLSPLSLVGVMLVALLVGCHDPQPVTAPRTETSVARQSADGNEFSKNLEDKTIAKDYEIRDGIVCFRSPAAFKEVAQNIAAFVVTFGQSNPTFVSYRQRTDQILEEGKAVATKAEADAFLTRYAEYVVEQDQTLIPRLQMALTQLINPEGLMYIGKILYLYQDDD